MRTRPHASDLPELLLNAATPRPNAKTPARYSIHDVRIVFARIVREKHPELYDDDVFAAVDHMHHALATAVDEQQPGQQLSRWLLHADPEQIRAALRRAAAGASR